MDLCQWWVLTRIPSTVHLVLMPRAVTCGRGGRSGNQEETSGSDIAREVEAPSKLQNANRYMLS